MTPDVNVLVAASRMDHPHHHAAIDWLESAIDRAAEDGSLLILPMAVSGFLRVVTHARVFENPTPIESALAFVDAILNSSGVTLAPVGDEWPNFKSICEKHKLSGNAIPDAWLAAAAQYHHQPIVTFDRGFRRLVKSSMVILLDT